MAITISIPASPGNIGVLRTMAMAVVSQSSAGVDAVSDAGLAIDEAAGLVFGVPGTSTITTTMTVERPIQITLASNGEAVFWPPQDFFGSLSETVLESISGDVQFQETGSGPQIRLQV
ncbi:MAG: hypothetical protein HKO03_07235 [Acidimicrobiia bacterium]|nr:hypothetical protein [Acidimicrobiia bacterium]